ncbi:hypothetical protein Bbelb_021760 [Branchiostoma belcheri]|nr:hypothetical protein Bbelb_021760 [Branchiostoma belcheri]
MKPLAACYGTKKILEEERVPAEWKEGDQGDCSNYRGIMLLSVPGKILNRVLLERMKGAVDDRLRDQQAARVSVRTDQQEVLKVNNNTEIAITVGGETIKEVESVVYLRSVMDQHGGTEQDVSARMGKTRTAFVMLKNIWASREIHMDTKAHLRHQMAREDPKCINEDLWSRAGQEPVAIQILRRKWSWIRHTVRKPADSTTRQALSWNPRGKRRRGRPRNSWRRDTERGLSEIGMRWKEIEREAQNRARWREIVAVAYAPHGAKCPD